MYGASEAKKKNKVGERERHEAKKKIEPISQGWYRD